MQEKSLTDSKEDANYQEYLKVKRQEEAKGNVGKIDCDLLSPNVDRATLKETCKKADALALGALVVFPSQVKACVSYLGSDPKVSLIAAIAYPYGEETTKVKMLAVKGAIKDGVDEVEVSAPATFLKEGNWAYFKKECKKLKKAAKGCALRVSINCADLGEKELTKACAVAADAGVNCLRLHGADGELLNKLKTAVKGKCLVKADGASETSQFYNFIAMGADYIGCTSALNMAGLLFKQAEEGKN